MTSLYLFAWWYSHTTPLSAYALLRPVCMVILSNNFTVRICLYYICLHGDSLIQLHCPYMLSLYLFAWWYSHTTSLSLYAFIIPVCIVILSYNVTVRISFYYTCLHGDTLIKLHCPYIPSLYLFAWSYSHTTSLSVYAFNIPVCMVIL